MITRILGPNSPSAWLKQGLDESSTRARAIADRIANASTPAFASALSTAELAAIDAEDKSTEALLEEQMVALADEQIRFEAMTRLLQKTYASARASVRERS